MDPCRPFAYRIPWLWIVAADIAGAVAMGTGVSRAIGGYPLAPHLAGTLSALALIGLGLILWGVSAWMLIARLRGPRQICLTDREISLSRSRWSSKVVAVPLDRITALRTAQIRDEPQMELIWPEGSATIGRWMFRDPTDFDRLLKLTRGRLAELGVPAEDWTAVESSRRRRPQFTIAWMMIAVTFVAMVLGTYSFVYGTYSWDVLLHLAITLAIVIGVPWLVTSAPPGAGIFALGFTVGAWLEWMAVFAGLSLGWLHLPVMGPARGWYPLTGLVWRVAGAFPSVAWLADGIMPYMIGGVGSGVLVGALALTIRRLTRRWRRSVPSFPLSSQDEVLMVAKPPKFVYFDLGKVIVDFNLEQMCRQMADVARVDATRVASALSDDDLQQRYEVGQVNQHQFYEAFCQAIGSWPDADALTRAGNEIFELNADIVPVIAQLCVAGYPLGILSNTCSSHWDYCWDRYWILRDLFSVYALSYRVGAAKPDARMFRAAADLAGTPPEEIFYLDDIADHIAGAQAAGFDAVQYTTTPALVAELRRRGVGFNY